MGLWCGCVGQRRGVVVWWEGDSYGVPVTKCKGSTVCSSYVVSSVQSIMIPTEGHSQFNVNHAYF